MEVSLKSDLEQDTVLMVVPLKNNPQGLGMTLSLTEPAPLGGDFHRCSPGTVLCLHPPSDINETHVLAKLKSSQHSLSIKPNPFVPQETCTVTDMDGGNEREIPVTDIMGRPGSVYVSAFKRLENGKKGEAESNGSVRLFDRILSVDATEAHDLSSVISAIRSGGETVWLTIERSSELDKLYQEDDLAEKRALEVLISLRVIFDCILKNTGEDVKRDKSQHSIPVGSDCVSIEDVMATGNTVFRKAGIILSSDQPLSEIISRELKDQYRDGLGGLKLSWTDFRDLFLVRLAGHCHAARQKNARAIFAEIDRNKDMKLSHSEVKACCENPDSLLNRTYPFMGKELYEHFSEIDSDSNGFLSEEEFCCALEEFWLYRMHPQHADSIPHNVNAETDNEKEELPVKLPKDSSFLTIKSPHYIEAALSHSSLGIHPLKSGELGTISLSDLEAEHARIVNELRKAVHRGELAEAQAREKIEHAMANISSKLEASDMASEAALVKLKFILQVRAAAKENILRSQAAEEARLEAEHRAKLAVQREKLARQHSESEIEQQVESKSSRAKLVLDAHIGNDIDKPKTYIKHGDGSVRKGQKSSCEIS